MRRSYHIIVNGAARSGKNTFINFFNFIFSPFNIYCCSSADKVYQAAELLGWDSVKDEKGRQFLCDLKNLSTKNYDGPMRHMKNQIEIFMKPYLGFFMIREPEEIRRFKKQISNTYTLLIKRSGIKQFNNYADLNVINYKYDFIIENDGTLDDLKEKAKKFLSNFE